MNEILDCQLNEIKSINITKKMTDVNYLRIVETMRRVSTKNMIRLSKAPDPDGKFLLHEELERAIPNESVISSLITTDPERVSKLNESGSNSLHVASQYIKTVDPSIFLLLIEADPQCCSVVNKYGLLPIHKAAMNSSDLTKASSRSFKMLLATHPDGIRQPNNFGQLALHLALSTKHPTMLIVNQLIESFPESLRVQDKFGHLPLHKACSNKKISQEIIISVLNSYRKGASYADVNGFTPLHWLACQDKPNVEVIKEFLKIFPMAVHIYDNQERKPVDLQQMRKTPCQITVFLLLDKQREILNGKFDERVYEAHEIFSDHSRPPTRDASVNGDM